MSVSYADNKTIAYAKTFKWNNRQWRDRAGIIVDEDDLHLCAGVLSPYIGRLDE